MARDEVATLVADLESVLRRLGDADLASAGTDAQLAAAAALEAAATSVHVAQARALAALDVVPPGRERVSSSTEVLDLSRVTPQEVSGVLGCSVESARSRVQVARAACTELPGALGEAAAGRLRWWQVRRVCEAVAAAGLSPTATALVDARVVEDARAGRSRARFGARVARHVLAADPSRAEAAHEDAVASRRTQTRPDAAGMSWFSAYLPAEDAAGLERCLDALADTPVSAPYGRVPAAGLDAPDDRLLDQRRADALSGLARVVLDTLHATDEDPTADVIGAVACTAAGSGRGASRPRRRPRPRGEIAVTVSAETLLGISNAPAELSGHGPITPAHARRIAGTAGTTWRRLLTDPVTGTLLDRGRTAHLPPAPLAAHVRARSGSACTRPECGHRAVDLDHATPWWPADGSPAGRTAADNLHGVCRGCHTAKHTGWTVSLSADGVVTWRSPHGWVSTSGPPDLRPEDRGGGRAGADPPPC